MPTRYPQVIICELFQEESLKRGPQCEPWASIVTIVEASGNPSSQALVEDALEISSLPEIPNFVAKHLSQFG